MPDLTVEYTGSLFRFNPTSPRGKEWLEHAAQSNSYQWVDGALMVDARYAEFLTGEAEKDGLVVV